MPLGHGYRSFFDQRFFPIRDNVLRLGQLLDAAIGRSIQALYNQDVGLAQQVVAEDAAINALRFTIEEECLVLIATQHPAASDLRAVIAAMNLVNDMERMGDHATGIAKTVMRMSHTPLVHPPRDLEDMAHAARDMLKRSLDAFLASDVATAKAVAREDNLIDRLYKQVFDQLLQVMRTDTEAVAQATYLLWCAHCLERIGDRVTNIAERVVFMTTGTMEELNLKEDNT